MSATNAFHVFNLTFESDADLGFSGRLSGEPTILENYAISLGK